MAVAGAGAGQSDAGVPATQIFVTNTTGGSLGLAFPNLSNLPNGANVATDLLDAADKHVPTLSLNARRKFFHALAVVMFIPGVAFDVCVFLAHLSTFVTD
jgi:hypothetical protein